MAVWIIEGARSDVDPARAPISGISSSVAESTEDLRENSSRSTVGKGPNWPLACGAASRHPGLVFRLGQPLERLACSIMALIANFALETCEGPG